MCCSGKSEACWMGSHFVAVCCPRFVCHIVLVVTWGGRGEGARIFCCDSTFLKSDKWQDLGNLVASCHISQTSQTRNGYKWFIVPGCLPDGWTNGRTKATEPWLPHLYHYHPTSKCVCVCVCVGGCVEKIVCPMLGSAPTDNKAEMSADTEPQGDWSHLVCFSSIILYFRISHCLYTLPVNRCTEGWSSLRGLIKYILYQTSLYLSDCLCVFHPPQFHNLQELRHSASLANKVFIQRDYSEGTTCKFQTKFPSELESRVTIHTHTQPHVYLCPS